jgi:hypothetical protein
MHLPCYVKTENFLASYAKAIFPKKYCLMRLVIFSKFFTTTVKHVFKFAEALSGEESEKQNTKLFSSTNATEL